MGITSRDVPPRTWDKLCQVAGPPRRTPQSLPADLSERAFQRLILELADGHGWLVYHTHDSRRSQPGFPDLVLGRERVIHAELKSAKGRLRLEQRLWLAALKAAGADARLWRPADWPEIVEVLTAARGQGQE